jgi:hypothetical protein
LEVYTAGQPPAHRKKRIAKKPIEKINKWAQEYVNTLYSLLNNNDNVTRVHLFVYCVNLINK